MRIREVHSRDAAALLALQQQLFPSQRATLGSVRQLMAAAATLYVAEQNGQLVGYAAAFSVPGLPQLLDLAGGVVPEQQRQGVATGLLKALLTALRPQPYQALTYAVTDMASPVAQFLTRHQFSIHHEEWELRRDNHLLVPAAILPEGFTLKRGVGHAAAATFHRLYDASFGPHPWYQPYSDEEILNLFSRRGLPWFLGYGSQTIGFIWYWRERDGQGIIEPVGLLPVLQGQGLGRMMLYHALSDLRRQGVAQVKIGAWRENAAAIHLYQSLNFQHTNTITHLQLTI